MACRVSCNLHIYDHVAPLLKSLYWLKIDERILYTIAKPVNKCKIGAAPPHLLTCFLIISMKDSCDLKTEKMWNMQIYIAIATSLLYFLTFLPYHRKAVIHPKLQHDHEASPKDKSTTMTQ